MMFYRRRASPKHRYSIFEVDYGGGGHRTRLKDQTINCCASRVPPAPVYEGARGRGAAGQEGRARRSPTPTGSRTPSFPSWSRRRGKEEGERKERGRRPPPCPIQTRGRGGMRPDLATLLFSTKAHLGPLNPRGVPVTPGTLVKSRFHPKHFRYPNIGFQYINLYVSTISSSCP